MLKMTLPGGFGTLDFEDWFRGLVAAFVSGGAGAITGGFTVSALDPKDYNLGDQKIYKLMFAMFLVNGILGAMSFLRTKPVPDVKVVTTTVKETGTTVNGKVEKTVQEVHLEPKDPPKTGG